MSEPFESNVKFTNEQFESMCTEIGEILGRLKDKQVIDFVNNIPIVLLDRHSISVEFEETKLLEIKRFVSLVRQQLPILTHLAQNPTFQNEVRESVRNDRIMGSINYLKTSRLRQSSNEYKKSVVCQEILRNYNAPENILLTLILFSILIYCDKSLALDALVESANKLNPTMTQLKTIRHHISSLLAMKIIRDILPKAIDSLSQVDELFGIMKNRIERGKIPRYYANILNFFEKWRNYFWVALDDKTVLKHVLRYHFMKLGDENDLYECWVFCKILYALADEFDLKLTEISNSPGKNVFVSSDNRIKIIYQARYETPWQRSDNTFIRDVPDVAVELSNGVRFILDAKNSKYIVDAEPYFLQLQSYLVSAKAKYGIVIHSASELGSSWYKVEDKQNNRHIIWTKMSPGSENMPNEGLSAIISLISSEI
jgi:hypothetical protein